MRVQKAGALAVFVCLFMVIGAAMCPVAVTPPDSFVHLTDESQGLIVWNEEDQTQQFVVRQAYEGVASDFGLILPTPSEPAMEERDEELFRQLHDLTKEPAPDRLGGVAHTDSMAAEEQVDVVKQEQIGDFDLAVLRANASEPLLDWLDEHNYTYGTRTEENIDYYIDQGGFYFTAMKINVDEASCLTQRQFERGTDPLFRQQLPEDGTGDGRCWLRGGLSPIEFTFETDEPMLPLRIMAKPHDDSPMTNGGDHDHEDGTHDEHLPPGNFLLYTVADQPLTVPGAKVQFADQLDSVDDPLQRYNVADRFLVRQRIKFDAHDVDDDLVFQEAEPFYESKSSEAVINPEQRDTANGMMTFDDADTRYVTFTDASLLDRARFRLQRTTARAVEQANTLWQYAVDAGSAAVLLTGGLLNEPVYLLLLLLPVLYGLLWRRRKALMYSVTGLSGGVAIGIIGLLLVEQPQTPMILLGFIAAVATLLGAVTGLIAFLISTANNRFDLLTAYQPWFAGIRPRENILAIGIPAATAPVIAHLIQPRNIVSFLPVYLLLLNGLTFAFLYEYRADPDATAAETERTPRRAWAMFGATLVCLIVLLTVIGFLLAASPAV